MTLLVTGASGFLGLNLLEHLAGEGRQVVALSLDGLPAAFRPVLAGLPGEVTEARGDIRDTDLLRGLLRDHAIRRIIHGATITSGPEREAETPSAVLDVNVMGSVRLMECACDARVDRLVLASSGAVYGDAAFGSRPPVEADPPTPNSLYGVSKVAMEGVALRLSALRGLPVRIARISAVFGPWERATGQRDVLSPPFQIARALLGGGRPELPETGARDWVGARHVARTLAALADRDDLPGPVYNVGAGAVWHPRDLLVRFASRGVAPAADAAGVDVAFNDRLDAPRQAISTARLVADGGPAHDLGRAQEQFVDWALANRGWFD